MFLRESIAANSREGKLRFRLRQNSGRFARVDVHPSLGLPKVDHIVVVFPGVGYAVGRDPAHLVGFRLFAINPSSLLGKNKKVFLFTGLLGKRILQLQVALNPLDVFGAYRILKTKQGTILVRLGLFDPFLRELICRQHVYGYKSKGNRSPQIVLV